MTTPAVSERRRRRREFEAERRRPGTGSVVSHNVVLDFDSHMNERLYVYFTAVDQGARSQVSVLICFSFGELVRTIIVSLPPDTWNSRTRFLPTSAAASAPSR